MDDQDLEDQDISFYRAIDRQRREEEEAERMEVEVSEVEEPDTEEAMEEKTKGKRGLVYPLKVTTHEQERHVNLLYTEQH